VLILVVSLAAWLSRQPLIFASLGPTAFEQIETPKRPSARPYNVIVGHLIAVIAGFAALYLTHAWSAPIVSAGHVTLSRVEATALSAALTVLGTLLARSQQPAAISTTLLVSLGIMQRWQDAVVIMVAVLLMTAAGEPLRRWRARDPELDDPAAHRPAARP
jgi:ABC-type Fe3+-siderophore transport system permease subunit